MKLLLWIERYNRLKLYHKSCCIFNLLSVAAAVKSYMDGEKVKSKGIICFGDSNTYGFDPRSFLGDRYTPEYRWCDILGKRLGSKVINMGQNGRTVPADSCKSLERAIEENPDCDMLVVMLGTNDILLGQQAEYNAEKMEKLILHLKELSGMNIILAAPPDIVFEDAFGKELKRLSEMYEKLAEKTGCYFCNTAKWNMELCYDGIHLTEKANIEFAERFAEFINGI